MKIEPLNIALSANERYMPGALVAAAGVAVYAKAGTPLHFHLFTEGVEVSTFEFFVSTLKRLHVETEVSRYECDEKILNGLPYWAGSRMAAVRCHYATLMPKVGWCLYLDCDVLYLASVEEHFSHRVDSAYACVVQEESPKTRANEREWIKENCGVQIPDMEYFNSGVVLFNLAKMRADGVPGKLAKFFADHPNVPSPDQDALNATFAGKIKMLPPKFNRLQIYLTDERLQERPVIHYVCGNPWLPKYGEVASGRFRLWHRFADKYIWGRSRASRRNCFTAEMARSKIVSYWLLKMPVLGWLFAYFMQLIGLTSNGIEWRKCQVGNDISAHAIRQVLS